VVLKTFTGLEQKFVDMVLPVLESLSLKLYDLEWSPRASLLTIYIFNETTKTALLDDCVNVDRGLGLYFETEEWIPENVTLEVSSPGVYRHLVTKEHFNWVIGSEIALTLNQKIDETKYPDFPKALKNNLKLKGRLIEVNVDGIIFDIKDFNISIPFSQIKKANVD
jgi:ribosome maturation factor RimP